MSIIPSTPDETPPQTLEHLLSLPQLLHPISPSLAALHLARVRLQFAIPKSITPDWCIQCGGLRDGGTPPRPRTTASKRGKAKSKAMKQADEDKSRGKGCSTCGYTYRKVKKIVFETPPARRVASTRRLRSAGAEAMDVDIPIPNTATVDVFGTPTEPSHGVPPIPIETPQTSLQFTLATTTPLPPASPLTALPPNTADTQPPSTIISPTKLTTRPSLSYILSTDPNPPTYPLPPPVVRSPSPPRNGTTKGGKKKKKSGLAKLLAESKARSEVDKGSGGGSWGL